MGKAEIITPNRTLRQAVATRLYWYTQLFRTRLAGLAAYPFVLGGIIGGDLTLKEALALFLIGVIHHSLACTLNDLADEEDDRGNDLRAGAPLVAGGFSRIGAIAAACALLLLITVVVGIWQQPPAAVVALVALLGLAAYGNLWQKRSRRVPPIVMDHLFGVMMGGPIVYGAIASGGTLRWALALLALSFWLDMTLMNCVAGNLKDLDADRIAGVRTTTIEFGVATAADGAICFPAAYRRYCHSLNFAAAAFLALSVVALGPLDDPPWLIARLSLVLVGAAAVAWLLEQLFSGRRRPSATGSEPYIYVQFLVLNAVLMFGDSGRAVAVLFVAAVAWVYVFAFIEVWSWRAMMKESAVE